MRHLKILDQGEAGNNVGYPLRGIDREAVERGQVVVRPDSATAHRKFRAEVYVLTGEEGGRRTRSSATTARSSTSARPT